jgi:RNA polymerase sigma-70 factor (ECF subfamily)
VIGVETSARDASLPADVQLADHEEHSLLLRALDTIDLERRAVLVLHEWDGEPIPEVARALGIPLNTAYSRLRAAREDLAAAVKRLTARRGT